RCWKWRTSRHWPRANDGGCRSIGYVNLNVGGDGLFGDEYSVGGQRFAVAHEAEMQRRSDRMAAHNPVHATGQQVLDIRAVDGCENIADTNAGSIGWAVGHNHAHPARNRTNLEQCAKGGLARARLDLHDRYLARRILPAARREVCLSGRIVRVARKTKDGDIS